MTKAYAAISAAAFATAIGIGLASADQLVAVPIPLSGPEKLRGTEILTGVLKGVAAINKAGGINGERLFVTTYDDKCSSDGGRTIAASLSKIPSPDPTTSPPAPRPRPAVVIGHPCASAAVAASKLYSRAGIPFLAPAVRHPALTFPEAPTGTSTGTTNSATETTTFRLTGNDAHEGHAAAAWLRQHAPSTRIAIIHDRTQYARTVAEIAEANLKKTGLKAVLTIGIIAGRHAYPEVVEALQANNIEALFFAGYPTEVGIILANMRQAGLRTAMLTTATAATSEFSDEAGNDPYIVRALLPHEPAEPLRKRAEAALQIWANAARRVVSQNNERPTLVETMRTNTARTVIGPVKFDQDGNLTSAPSFSPAQPAKSTWQPIRSSP